ncbi:MAG: hypothetical protein WAM28_03820 [Chlamydiales bacterium]
MSSEKAKCTFYVQAVERIIQHVLPPNFFDGEDVAIRFHTQLPIVCWSPLAGAPCSLSFFLCCFFRPNAYRFFSEMITRWLIPGRRINAHLQFTIDFSLPDLGDHKYIGAEVMLNIETEEELKMVQKKLPVLESEIRLGLESSYQASRILERKGLTADEKTALIQENLVSLIRHRPQDFDYDILSEMQLFLVLCKEDFKAAREYRHMSRIICVHYLFRKALKLSLEAYPDRRYISIKLIRAQLPNNRRVLGIAIGLSFLRDNEIFEAKHILNGIQEIISGVKKVEGSFFCSQNRSDSPCILYYLEVEKENHAVITLEEEQLLKEKLPLDLKNRIEQRLNPIFMPQNEEEIIRHIINLSHQLKYVRDLPQAVINFNQQTEEKLEFLVVVLRVALPNLPSISKCFETHLTFLEYIPDRVKTVGSIRKKYKKEATVFRLCIRKSLFLRKNQSVDLYKARQEMARELARVIGEFRDYNGGTISKETELFEQLRYSFGKQNGFLLENFFYSLNPPSMRSILPVEPIKKLFSMLLETEEEGLVQNQDYQISVKEDASYFYLLLIASDASFRGFLLPRIESLKISTFQMATCTVPNTNFPSFGLIYREATLKEAIRLRLTVEQAMNEWANHKLVSLK